MRTNYIKNQAKMQKNTRIISVKVNLMDSNLVEISVYEGGEDKRYRSWKLPKNVADCIVSWWQQPDNVKTSGTWQNSIRIDIPRPSTGHFDFRELDAMGRPKIVGWSLPEVAVRAMSKELKSLKNIAK